MAFVTNQPENYEFLNVTDQATGDTLPHASRVFWFDGTSWHMPQGLSTTANGTESTCSKMASSATTLVSNTP